MNTRGGRSKQDIFALFPEKTCRHVRGGHAGMGIFLIFLAPAGRPGHNEGFDASRSGRPPPPPERIRPPHPPVRRAPEAAGEPLSRQEGRWRSRQALTGLFDRGLTGPKTLLRVPAQQPEAPTGGMRPVQGPLKNVNRSPTDTVPLW